MKQNRIALTVGLVCCLPLYCFAAKPAEPGKQIEASAELEVGKGDSAKKVEMHYLLFLPKQYSQEQKRWPLMLFLHGSGERGNGNLTLVKKHGPPKLVEERPDFPFIVVSPQCPTDERWQADQLSKLIDHIESSYAVDESRIYVTGLSMGGAGTWALITAEPDRFAAAIPICGGGGGNDTSRAKRLVDLPIWVFYGDKDRAETLARSKAMVQAIQDAGGKKVQMTIYPGVGHNSWERTYDNEKVYQWLLSHQRGAKK